MSKSKRKTLTDDEFTGKFLDGLQNVLQNNSPASDMAIALVLTSLVEHSLMRLIESRFVDVNCGECEPCKAGERCNKNEEVFSVNHALESFSKCSDVAVRMGLISWVFRKNLQRIGSIRNRFAHHPGVIDFSDEEIAMNCGQMSPGLQRLDDTQNVGESMSHVIVNDPTHGRCIDPTKLQRGSKGRFLVIAVAMIQEMNAVAVTPNRPTPIVHGRVW